ncbi:MAG: hypothetical protein IKA32_04585, partial [Lentisphaeria bacterium]|nr:hypothetical protein [Lentisphaeria bacterium]
VVTAKTNQTGKSTASSISRQAMDHLQATSLNDLLSLIDRKIQKSKTSFVHWVYQRPACCDTLQHAGFAQQRDIPVESFITKQNIRVLFE